jgi:hypothetical protein
LPVIKTSDNSLETFIFREVSGVLGKLPDGKYSLSLINVLVDKNGKLIYYEIAGLYPNRSNNPEVSITDDERTEMYQQIGRAMEQDATFKPATLKGKKVNAVTSVWLGGKHKIIVADHTATLE